MTIEERLNGLRTQFLSNIESKGPYWSLHRGSKLIGNNHNEPDPDHSFELLRDAILYNYQQGVHKFGIRQKSAEKDSRPIDLTIELPRKSMYGVHGIGYTQPQGISQEMLKLHLEIQELKNSKEIERLQREKAQAEAANATVWNETVKEAKELILGIFKSESVESLGKVFADKVANRYFDAQLGKVEQVGEGETTASLEENIKYFDEQYGEGEGVKIINDLKKYHEANKAQAEIALKMIRK